MVYRTLGRTGLQVSEIGMGCEGFVDKSCEEVLAFVDRMEALGVNCVDLYTSNPEVRSNLGRALRGRREKFVLQAHLCSVWKDGQYKRTRNIDEVRAGFMDQLERLETDRVEISGTIIRKYISDGHIPDELMMRRQIFEAILSCGQVFIM